MTSRRTLYHKHVMKTGLLKMLENQATSPITIHLNGGSPTVTSSLVNDVRGHTHAFKFAFHGNLHNK